MIDIHSHILPMVDDGASSVDQALKMLIQAYEDGTDEIILTPHLAYAYNYINHKDKIFDLYRDLRYIVEREGIPIKIHLGCEFLFSSKETFEGYFDEITFINDTRYLLIEFFFDVDKNDFLEAIDTIIDRGYIPVIAHPERYECVKISTDVVKEGYKKGALFQMNKGSLFGDYGRLTREVVFELLDQKLISFVGSDAHNTSSRNVYMYEAYELVRHYYGRRYARDLFKNNPRDMLENKDIRKRGNDEKMD